MKVNRPLILSIALFILVLGCDDCDDCLDLQQKNILVQDSDGNNLLFGDNVLFDPSMITVSFENGQPQFLFVNQETQTVSFFLEENQTSYTLQLNNDVSMTLMFELGERKSERCCGNQIYSISTRLDGQEIDNSNTITIVN